MAESEYGSNRSAIFPGQPDLSFVAQAFDQISEPASRLRKQMMTPPCHQKKSVEFIHKLFGPASFVGKSFLFCSLDFALKRILVQSAKKLFYVRSQIKLMEPVGTTCLYTIFQGGTFLQRANATVPRVIPVA